MTWILNKLGFVAIPLPWGTIYYLDIAFFSPRVRRHELVHIAQIRREGVILWLMKYFYYIAKTRYHNNPYEVEARRLSDMRSNGQVYELAHFVMRKYDHCIVPPNLTDNEAAILDEYNNLGELEELRTDAQG